VVVVRVAAQTSSRGRPTYGSSDSRYAPTVTEEAIWPLAPLADLWMKLPELQLWIEAGPAVARAMRPQLTVIGVLPDTSRQSTEAKAAGSMVPLAITQSMSSCRISFWRL
jgi:hypothetical protein